MINSYNFCFLSIFNSHGCKSGVGNSPSLDLTESGVGDPHLERVLGCPDGELGHP